MSLYALAHIYKVRNYLTQAFCWSITLEMNSSNPITPIINYLVKRRAHLVKKHNFLIRMCNSLVTLYRYWNYESRADILDYLQVLYHIFISFITKLEKGTFSPLLRGRKNFHILVCMVHYRSIKKKLCWLKGNEKNKRLPTPPRRCEELAKL